MDDRFRINPAFMSWWKQHWPWLRWLLLVLALAAVVVAVLSPLPALLTRHPSHGLTSAEWLKATNDTRATLVQAVVGLALLAGLVFTARALRLTAKSTQGRTPQYDRGETRSTYLY